MSESDKVTALFDDQAGFSGALKIEPTPDPLNQQVMLLARWRKLLAVRWLCFIALLAANAVWVYTVIEPTPWRFAVACAFSVLVLIPTFVLYHWRAD